jgi:hypothetical protein
MFSVSARVKMDCPGIVIRVMRQLLRPAFDLRNIRMMMQHIAFPGFPRNTDLFAPLSFPHSVWLTFIEWT